MTQVPNSNRKLHSIHSLVHTALRVGFKFSSFPPRPMKIELWPRFKLKRSTADRHNPILDDRSSVHQSVGTLLSAVLNCQQKTHRNMQGEAVEYVHSHYDLLCNVIRFVVHTIYVDY